MRITLGGLDLAVAKQRLDFIQGSTVAKLESKARLLLRL